MNPNRVEAIQKWPAPKTVREVLSFLGFVQFFRKFIKGFSAKALPLTRLTQQNTVFKWDQKCQEAFEKLRTAVTTAPVLQIFPPDKGEELEVHTDAS